MTGPVEAQVRQLVDLLNEHLRRAEWQLRVAESLTGGQLAAAISEGPHASEWFKGRARFGCRQRWGMPRYSSS